MYYRIIISKNFMLYGFFIGFDLAFYGQVKR